VGGSISSGGEDSPGKPKKKRVHHLALWQKMHGETFGGRTWGESKKRGLLVRKLPEKRFKERGERWTDENHSKERQKERETTVTSGTSQLIKKTVAPK